MLFQVEIECRVFMTPHKQYGGCCFIMSEEELLLSKFTPETPKVTFVDSNTSPTRPLA